MQWPALRSDYNGQFTDAQGTVQNKGFRYYTNPSLWDTYRNKLVVLSLLSPEVTGDIIQSLIDKGTHSGFMPTFFHGDHAAPFVTQAYGKGITNFDVKPKNQASIFSFVVPVLPARFRFKFLSFLPVPLLITPSIIEVI